MMQYKSTWTWKHQSLFDQLQTDEDQLFFYLSTFSYKTLYEKASYNTTQFARI